MNETDRNKLLKYIEEKIYPHTLNELGKSNISILLKEFNLKEVCDAIDIGYNKYIHIDKNGEPTSDSVEIFLNKIGGIAHNNALPPIEKKIMHLKNICKSKFNYWDDKRATTILNNYIKALKINEWSDEQILNDLNTETMDAIKECNNWTQFRNLMDSWTNSLLKSDEGISNSFIVNNNLLINKKYKIIKEIGSGSFGITYLAIDERLNKYFVIKEFACEMLKKEDNRKFFKKFISEIRCLFDLNNNNIVRIYDYIINEEKQIGCYIMELIEGKNIHDYIKENRKSLCNVFLQAINVFKYLEDNKLCHRDVRINNILIDNHGTLKLIDFGFVKLIENNSTIHSATQLIVYPYEWPEELKNKKQKYDNKTEIYFVGQLFSEIIKKMNIKKFKYIKIINKMCEFKREERYNTFSEILKEIS